MKRLLIALFCILTLPVFANEPAAAHGEAAREEAFNPGEMILHHIGDSHEWHWFSTDNGHFTAPLPIIAYRPGKGLSTFSSCRLAEGQSYDGLKLEPEHLVSEDGSKVYDL